MERLHFVLMRLAGLGLVLLFYGGGLAFDIHSFGDRYTSVKIAPAAVGTVLGLFAIMALWSASRLVYSNQLTILMVVLFLVGFPLRLVVDHVTWDVVLRNVLIVVGAFILAFGHGKADDDLPLAKGRRWSEARGLPRLNKRRAKKGLPPVASFQEARKEQRRSS